MKNRHFEWTTLAILGALLAALKGKEIYDENVSISNQKRRGYYNGSLQTQAHNELSYSYFHTPTAELTIVLCHGLGATSNSMMLLADQIKNRQKCNIVVFDRPGYRRSKVGSVYPYVIKEAVDDLKDLIDSILPAEAKVSIVGHSLGGYIAHRYTVENPERLEKVWLIEPTNPKEIFALKGKRRGVLAITEMIRINADLAKLGMATLKSESGSIAHTAKNNPYSAQIAADLDTGRTWAAMRREWEVISKILLDEQLGISKPSTKVDVHVIASHDTLNSSDQQRGLFEEYLNGTGSLHEIELSSHQELVLSLNSVEKIAKKVGI